MKRFLILLGLLAGLGMALVALRAAVSTEVAAARIAGVLVPFGYAKPTISADVTVRLFPRLSVVLRDVSIVASPGATRDRPDLAADSIVANIDVLPLLIGQTSVSQLVLDRPRLRLTTTFDQAGLTPAPALLTRMLPASIVVHDGEIQLVSPDGARTETVQAIEADVRWPRALGNLSLDGTALWRGERLTLSMQGIAPPRLAAGESGDLDLTLDLAALRLTFSGSAHLSDRLQLDGTVSLAADEPHRIANLLAPLPAAGGPAPTPVSPPAPSAPGTHGTMSSVAVAGHIKSQGWMASVSDARAKVGNVDADGVLSVRFDLARPQLRGTLAIGDIDLSPAVAALSRRSWLDWSPAPLIAAGLDLDLRLSVGEARVGATRLTNLAASFLVSDGQIHADIGDADVLGGSGSLTAHGAVDRDGIKAGGRISLLGLSFNALRSLLRLDGVPAATGNIALVADFETAGATLRAAIAHLRAHIQANASQLALDDPNEPALALAATRSPLLQAAGVQLGLNPEVDGLACTLSYAEGNVAIQRLAFSLADLSVELSGKAASGEHRLELAGTARPQHAPMPIDGPGVMLPIGVGGTVARPEVVFGVAGPDAAPDANPATGTVPVAPSAPAPQAPN